jgi:hypothetical protein
VRGSHVGFAQGHRQQRHVSSGANAEHKQQVNRDNIVAVERDRESSVCGSAAESFEELVRTSLSDSTVAKSANNGHGVRRGGAGAATLPHPEVARLRGFRLQPARREGPHRPVRRQGGRRFAGSGRRPQAGRQDSRGIHLTTVVATENLRGENEKKLVSQVYEVYIFHSRQVQ